VFKQSHAISYAALVALHMNLLNTTDQGNWFSFAFFAADIY
jgi:hypothetical protein